MLAHLGYPPYFSYVLGPWQFACAGALLAPRLLRVKEWAYAGAFFNYSSAIASHLSVGDAPQETIGAVLWLFSRSCRGHCGQPIDGSLNRRLLVKRLPSHGSPPQ
jgi:DoxX-like family